MKFHSQMSNNWQWLAAGREKVSFKSVVPVEGHTSTNGQHRLGLMGVETEDTELDG